MRPPYELKEGNDDVLMEFELPFWIDRRDVFVDITASGVRVEVRNELTCARTFWENEEQKKKKGYIGPVAVADSHWTLDDDTNNAGEPCKTLTVHLVKPPLNEDEVQWKRSVREDNRAARRNEPGHRKGFRFFVDDEDYYSAEETLQAMLFLETGEAFVPAKPYRKYHPPHEQDRLATSVEQLSEEARATLDKMLELDDEKELEEIQGGPR